MSVEQSGSITPGNIAVWTTDDVIEDGGQLPGTSEMVLARLLSANMNSTSDQQINLPIAFTKVALTRILICNASISLTTAVGGFYPTTSKGGTPIVAASQVYSSLTAANKLLSATLAAFGSGTAFGTSDLTAWSIYFALTTPQGAAATADIYICGIPLAP